MTTNIKIYIQIFLLLITTFSVKAQELNIEKAGLDIALQGYFSFDNNNCSFGEGSSAAGTLIGNTTITNEGYYTNSALTISPKNGQSAYMVLEGDNSEAFRMDGAEAMTLAFWIKPIQLSDGTRQNILKLEKNGYSYYFEINDRNNFNTYLSTISKGEERDFGNAFVQARNQTLTEDRLEQWYHLAMTFDGDSTRMYVNGQLNSIDYVRKPGYVLFGGTDRLLYIGNQEDEQGQFEGTIDELYLYSRALAADEIVTLMEMENPLDEYFDIFEVKFDPNNNGIPVIEEAQPSNNYTVQIPEITSIGYHFKSWNTAADGSGETLASNLESIENISADITYYAQWEVIDYSINYQLNVAVNSENNPSTFTVEDLPLKLEHPTLSGQRFKYWYTDENLENRLGNNTIDQVGNLTLWPSWQIVEEGAPSYTDYCEMLSRDINGDHYGFMAGNKMYYVAGSGQAEYKDMRENETLGFTHPMFRDGRARGHGVVDGTGGVGHDLWGWEFWRRVKSAYGTVIINGKRYPHPTPKSLDWRPDKMIVKYEVAGVHITEEKFISENDVLSTIITADQPITIEFEGESYYDTRDIPTSDGDAATPRSQSCTSTVDHNTSQNTVVLLENGTAMAKTIWGEQAVVGEMMYAGLHFVYTSDHTLYDFKSETLSAGNVGYSFTLDIPAYEKVGLSLSVDDIEENAVNRAKEDLADIGLKRDQKTEMMNGILNNEIPYFRCSDQDVVDAYYFLWSLYFMYFMEIGEGWETYPHTQTAVNNFMGLHLYDSWGFCGAGSYTANQEAWSFGNALSWKYMVQYKNEVNFMPDNFGTYWYSPETRMNFNGAVGQIWKQFDHSGDMDFLQEVYFELLRPLYIDNESKSIGVNEAQELGWMAEQLGETEDLAYWKSVEEQQTDLFLNNKWPWLMEQYNNDSWKNSWHVHELRNRALTPEMTEEHIDKFVLDTERGFISPNGINTRSADSPPNGIFRAASMSTWLGIDGVFTQGVDHGGIAITLNHYDAMTREYGYPVAPEAWDHNDEAWGSRYYNWDIAVVMPIIEWIGGTKYSFVNETFTYNPRLPDSWDFVEMKVPVVVDGKTNWVHTKVNRVQEGERFALHHSISGNPLKYTQIQPWDDERIVLEKSSTVEETFTDHGKSIYSTTENQLDATWYVGNKIDTLETLVWTKPRSREFANEVNIFVDNLMLGTTLRYTTDGSIPTENSPIFPDTLKITETTTFTFKAFGFNAEYEPYVATYQNIALNPDEEISETLFNGLKYKVFDLEEGTRSLPDFTTLTVLEQGTITGSEFAPTLDFDAVGKLDHEYFGLHLSGFIKVPEDKIYEFFVRSDDGCIIKIDGEEIIYLDGVSDKDPWFAEGSIGLEAGYHYIDMYYTQYSYRQKLSLEYKELGDREYKLVTQDMFYATEKYGLTFDENGAEQIDDLYLNVGENITPPLDPTREGYTFGGWYTDASFATLFDFPATMPSNDLRAFAKWDTDFYNVYYEGEVNGVEVTSGTVQFSIDDLPLTLFSPTSDNYRFVGWYEDKALTIPLENNQITTLNDHEVWAKFTIPYRIAYHLEEGAVNPEGQKTNFLEKELPITILAPHFEGRVFEGWYTDKDFTKPLEGNQITTKGDVTLYAKFYEEYSITYHLEEGIENPNLIHTFNATSLPITLEEPVIEGMYFDGWYTNEALTERLENNTITTEGNLHLYGQHLPATTLSFYIDEEVYHRQYVAKGEELFVQLPEPPTKEGFEFGGWFTSVDCIGIEVNNNSKTEQDMKVFACFRSLLTNTDDELASQFKLFPNPSNGNKLTISAPKFLNGMTVEISIYDLTGTQLFKQEKTIHYSLTTLDISKLPSGYYMLSIQEKGNAEIIKMLKMIRQ